MAIIKINKQEIWIGTNETKEQFIEKAKNMAKNYEILKAFFEKAFRPVLSQYHGKELNNRFMLALQTAAMEVDEHIVISSVNRYEDQTSFIHVSTTYGNGSGDLSLRIVEKFANSNERLINEAATLHQMKPWREDFKTKEEEIQAQADGCLKAIENYDDYMKQAAALKVRIDSYNELPWCFHAHICRDYLSTY